MTDWEVGQTATVTIGTPDGAVDTTLTLTVTAPLTGTVTHPTATPNTNHTEWTLLLEVTEPGDWTIVAIAEGTGAGEASYTLHTAPQPPPSTGMYANTGDYATYTGEAPKAGLPKLLRRATLDVRRQTMTAVYDVDAVTKLPTDAGLLQALKDAVCEQASYCIDTGRAKGVVTPTSSFTLGKLSASKGGSSGSTASGPNFSPHAFQILNDAGLTGAGPLN